MSNLGIAAVVGLVLLVGALLVLRGRNGRRGAGAESESDPREPTGSRSGRANSAGGSDPVAESGAAGRPEADGDAETGTAVGVARGETEVTNGGPAVEGGRSSGDGPSEIDEAGEEDPSDDGGSAASDGSEDGEGASGSDQPAYIGEPGSEVFDPESGEVVLEEPDGGSGEGGSAPAEEGPGEVLETAGGTSDADRGLDSAGDREEELGEEMSEDEKLWDLPDSVLRGEGRAAEDDRTAGGSSTEAGSDSEAGGEPSSSDSPASAGGENESSARGESDRAGSAPSDRAVTESTETEDVEFDEEGPGYGVVNPPESEDGENPSEASDEEGSSVLGFEGPRSGSTDEPDEVS